MELIGNHTFVIMWTVPCAWLHVLACRQKKLSRKDNEEFRPVPAAVLPEGSQSTLAAYVHSGFHRGHNVPYGNVLLVYLKSTAKYFCW